MENDDYETIRNPHYGQSQYKSKEVEKPSRVRNLCLLIALLVLVGAVACASIAVAVWNTTIKTTTIKELENSTVSVQGSQDVSNANCSAAIGFLQQKIDSLTQSLSGQLPPFAATSCLEISLLNYSAQSGNYLVRASNGSVVRPYCDMTRSCGNITGGWMRVANLDFQSHSCPDGFGERTGSTIRTCSINTVPPNCPSIVFDTYGIPYTRACGKVIAFQYGSADAFGSDRRGGNPTIDSNYVDGVSLTYGSNPRKHIWTFAAALDEFGADNDGRAICECSHAGRNGGSPPAFVGQDYFCDSGVNRRFTASDFTRFFSSSPLWDGAGCGSNSTCCSFNNPPWFYKELSPAATDNVEMRVCTDEVLSSEDIGISRVEVYVQ